MAKGKVAVGALFGAVAGFVTGILLAPKSGKETRNDLRNATLDTKDTVVESAEKAKDAAEKKAQEVKTWGEDVVEEVSGKATELKSRAEQAVEGAKKGFNAKPKTKK